MNGKAKRAIDDEADDFDLDDLAVVAAAAAASELICLCRDEIDRITTKAGSKESTNEFNRWSMARVA